VKRLELEDKTWVYYWYKEPDLPLQSQIKEVVDQKDLEGIESIDIVSGCNHGGGRCC
jgi:hypothetical protein